METKTSAPEDETEDLINEFGFREPLTSTKGAAERQGAEPPADRPGMSESLRRASNKSQEGHKKKTQKVTEATHKEDD